MTGSSVSTKALSVSYMALEWTVCIVHGITQGRCWRPPVEDSFRDV